MAARGGAAGHARLRAVRGRARDHRQCPNRRGRPGRLTGGIGALETLLAGHARPGRAAPLSPAQRYGALFADASRKTGSGHDVIWLGVIDWHFRIQRPQHLATNLADTGARVLYVSPVFEAADEKGRFRIVDAPHPGVFDIRMRLAGDPSRPSTKGLSRSVVGELQLALDELIAVLGIKAPVVLVEHPAWHEVACGVPGATVVYDCLDLAAGFSNVAKSTAVADAAMIAGADLVITASRPLAEHVAEQRSSILIRNAAEVEFFAQGFCDSVAGSARSSAISGRSPSGSTSSGSNAVPRRARTGISG